LGTGFRVELEICQSTKTDAGMLLAEFVLVEPHAVTTSTHPSPFAFRRCEQLQRHRGSVRGDEVVSRTACAYATANVWWLNERCASSRDEKVFDSYAFRRREPVASAPPIRLAGMGAVSRTACAYADGGRLLAQQAMVIESRRVWYLMYGFTRTSSPHGGGLADVKSARGRRLLINRFG
jgi:hypothetical protein